MREAVTTMTVAFVAAPEIPPGWDVMSAAQWWTWANEYAVQFADLCETDDRRLGLTPALSRAARRNRLRRGVQIALHTLARALPDDTDCPAADMPGTV